MVATAVGYKGITQSDAQRAAGTVTLVTAVVLLAVLLVAYYAGGYVAGRMSRFDGGRQGVTVRSVGLLVTLVAVALGWVAGDQYNLFDRVDVPRIPIPSDEVTCGGIVTRSPCCWAPCWRRDWAGWSVVATTRGWTAPPLNWAGGLSGPKPARLGRDPRPLPFP